MRRASPECVCLTLRITLSTIGFGVAWILAIKGGEPLAVRDGARAWWCDIGCEQPALYRRARGMAQHP
jgi:hypothetical protein